MSFDTRLQASFIRALAVGLQTNGPNRKRPVFGRNSLKPSRPEKELRPPKKRSRPSKKKRAKEKAESATFGQAFEKYIEWAKSNKKRWDDDISRYNVHLKKDLENVKLTDVSPFLLEKIKKGILDKGKAPATAKHALVVVRQVFNKLRVLGIPWRDLNPVSDVKLPRVDNRKERVLTHDEEDALLDALGKVRPSAKAMAQVALNAGLRFEEIATLRWQDVKLDERSIRVQGKGDRVRVVPMNDVLFDMFKFWRPNKPEPLSLVFPNANGDPHHRPPKIFYKTVKRTGLNDGVFDRRDKADFHTLRHTAATRLGNMGVPAPTLCALMGWTSLAIAYRYCKPDAEIARSAVNLLGKKHAQDPIISITNTNKKQQ